MTQFELKTGKDCLVFSLSLNHVVEQLHNLHADAWRTLKGEREPYPVYATDQPQSPCAAELFLERRGDDLRPCLKIKRHGYLQSDINYRPGQYLIGGIDLTFSGHDEVTDLYSHVDRNGKAQKQ